MAYGIIFQEYHLDSSLKKSVKFVQIHMSWVILTTLLTMAFMGNLKSSLIYKGYERRTMNISEIVDKDMIVHGSAPIVDWWRTPMGQLSPINKRLFCQVEKTNSTFQFG